MAGRPPKQAKNKKSKTTTIVKVNNLNFSSPRCSIQHTFAIVHIYCKLQSNLSILPEYKLLMLGFLFFLIPLLLCQEISLSARIYLLSRTLVSSNNYTPLLYLHFPNWVLNGLNLISIFFFLTVLVLPKLRGLCSLELVFTCFLHYIMSVDAVLKIAHSFALKNNIRYTTTYFF